MACATCHLEGDEDGHTWHFAGQGPRRTQALSVGLEGTAPFHWVGDMTDLGKLMETVFVGRMAGVHEAQRRSTHSRTGCSRSTRRCRCGGTAHTADLTAAQIDDLVAYPDTL